MTRPRLVLLLAAAWLAAAGFVLVSASPASAHAVLTSSTPTDGQILATPPQEVQITFSESVSAQLGGLTVLNSSGERVDNDDTKIGTTGVVLSATVKPDLLDGTYVMNYRVVSSDGHPISGAIVFGVGEQTVVDTSGVQGLEAGKDPGFELAAGVARFVTYVGALLAAGLAVFVTFVHDQRPDRWKLTPIVRAAAVVGGIGAVATVALQAALLTGDGFSAMTDVSTLRQALTEGLDWATVILLVGLALVHLSTDTSKPVVGQSLAFYGGLTVAASFAFWGHSTTADPRWLSFISDFVHVATGAIWFGGLVGLGSTLWRRRREPTMASPAAAAVAVPVGAVTTRAGGTADIPGIPSLPVDPPAPPAPSGEYQDGEDIATSTARMVSRFSTMAGLSLVLLVVAGTVMAWEELGGFSALGSTDYGRALLIKIGIVLLVLIGAAYNRFRLLPQIEHDEQAMSGRELHGSAWRHLTTSVIAEVVLIVVVLGVTSVLVNITPPKNAVAESATSSVQNAPVGDTNVEVVLTPASVGANSVHITYFDSGNRPIDLPQQVSVEMTEPEQGVGPIQRDAVKAATGHFIIDGMQIPTAGEWTLTLITRISDFEQERTDFTYTVSS
jgi:copper transport protein